MYYRESGLETSIKGLETSIKVRGQARGKDVKPFLGFTRVLVCHRGLGGKIRDWESLRDVKEGSEGISDLRRRRDVTSVVPKRGSRDVSSEGNRGQLCKTRIWTSREGL